MKILGAQLASFNNEEIICREYAFTQLRFGDY